MTLTIAKTSVLTSATILFASNSSMIKRTIKNRGGGSIYLGGSGVTTASGMLLRSGEDFKDTMFTGALYGIAGSTVVVSTLEES